jgi:hypothetical protein
MYVSGKMRSVEIIPGRGGGSTMIYFKNFCKGHIVGFLVQQ